MIHWCCLEHGLIRTVAKGARRPGSPFAGKLDLFYTVDFVWGRARKSDLHLLREVEVMEFRTGLQTSWLRVLCASYFVQLLEAVTEPETPVPGLFHLLRRGLDYLNQHEPDRRAVLHYEKQMALELGVLGESDPSPIAALRQMLHRVPPARDSLWQQLRD